MTNQIEQAAAAEKAAEQDRKTAETAWRAAWWDTTLALANVEGGDGEITRAYEAAGRILGQASDYLKKRRRTGRDLGALERTKIIALPPRLAMEFALAGGLAEDAYESLMAAEADGVSLRDFAAELGTQPASWQREGERTTTPEQAKAAADDWTPEQKAEVAKELIKDQGVADKVASDPGARGHMIGAVDRHTEQSRDHRPLTADEPGNPLNLVWEFRQLHKAIDRIAAEVSKRGAITSPEARDALIEEVGWLRNALGMIEEGIRGGSVDAALARIIREGSE